MQYTFHIHDWYIVNGTAAPEREFSSLIDYWHFVLEYMSLVQSVIARRSLRWKSPHERHWGDPSG